MNIGNAGRILILAACASMLGAPTVAQSPAERAIERHSERLANRPDEAKVWVDLSYAYARRARETADTENYELARAAAEQALELDGGLFDAKKARIWVQLGLHEFAAARRLAESAQKQHGEDLQLLGMLVDAYIEFGDYPLAERAAERMLSMGPGHPASLTRASYLRELFGDLDGAVDLMSQALQSTPAAETEQTAWILVQLAHLQRQRNSPESAAKLLGQALELFPGYHYALAERAKLARDAGELDAAVRYYRARYNAAPHPECLYDLALALETAGNSEEADDAFRRFVAEARVEMNGWDNANRELIRYYIGRGAKPKEGLRIAEMEIGRRQDLFTRTVFAEALAANGLIDRARRELLAVLELGTKDLKILQVAEELGGRG